MTVAHGVKPITGIRSPPDARANGCVQLTVLPSCYGRVKAVGDQQSREARGMWSMALGAAEAMGPGGKPVAVRADGTRISSSIIPPAVFS